MLAALFATMLAIQSPSIGVSPAEADSACADGNSATQLRSSEATPTTEQIAGLCTHDEGLLISFAQIAWDELEFERAAILATASLDLLAHHNCAWTPTASRLAFASGFSRRATGLEDWRFHFFIADIVDRNAGGLDRAQRQVARFFSDGFGTYPQDDGALFGSPYIEPAYATDATMCAQFPDFDIQADGTVDDVAIAVFDLDRNRRGDIRRVRPVLSYPGPVPSRISREIRSRRLGLGSAYGLEFFIFRPCLHDAVFADEGEAVCIAEPAPGAPLFDLGPKQ